MKVVSLRKNEGSSSLTSPTTGSLQAVPDVAALGISEDMILPAAAAVLAIVAGAAIAGGASGGGGSGDAAVDGPKRQKIQYDAAALLDYENTTPVGTRSIAAYEKYKELYKERSIAEVKIKVLERKVAAIDETMKTLSEGIEFKEG